MGADGGRAIMVRSPREGARKSDHMPTPQELISEALDRSQAELRLILGVPLSPHDAPDIKADRR
jgi:hypothetical protein